MDLVLSAVSSLAVAVFALAVAVALGPTRRTDLVTAAIGCWLLSVTVMGKVLLVAGLFRPAPVATSACWLAAVAAVWLCRGGPAADAARERLRRLRLPAPAPSPRSAPFAWFGAILVALVYSYRLLLAVRLPPMDVDSLWYHLVSVAAWVRTGRLAPPIDGLGRAGQLGWSVSPSPYPRDTELVSAWFAVFTHNVSLVGLTQFPFVALLGAAVFGICRRFGASGRTATLCSCAVLLTPAVMDQVNVAYNDIARAAVPAAAWQILLVAYGVGEPGGKPVRRMRWLLFAGALLGLGIGVKTANLYALPAAVLAVGALEWHGRTGTPHAVAVRTSTAVGALAAAVAVFGSFWYLETWRQHGTLFRPVHAVPFGGQGNLHNLLDAVRPTAWRHESTAEIVLRSWLAAVPDTGRSAWYAQWTGQLGLVWLFACVPALVALLAYRPLRRDRGPLIGAVVVPLLLAAFAAPGPWYSRYTILALVPGVVAIAVVSGGLAERVTQAPRGPVGAALGRAVLPAVALLCMVGVAGGAWSTNYLPFEYPTHRTAAGLVQAAMAAQPERGRSGSWGMYPYVQALPAGARIGFCAQSPPMGYLPMVLIGSDFRHVLVDLGSCGSPSEVRNRMLADNAGYLYAPDQSPISAALRQAAGGLGEHPLETGRQWVLPSTNVSRPISYTDAVYPLSALPRAK